MELKLREKALSAQKLLTSNCTNMELKRKFVQ